MRISDWSSDVCSSDLAPFTMVRREKQRTHILVPHRTDASHVVALRTLDLDHVCTHLGQNLSGEGPHDGRSQVDPNTVQRSPSLNGGRHRSHFPLSPPRPFLHPLSPHITLPRPSPRRLHPVIRN